MVHEVAVKTLTHGAGGSEKIKLLQEAAIMGQFHHRNVLQLYGVVVESDAVSRLLFYSSPKVYIYMIVIYHK